MTPENYIKFMDALPKIRGDIKDGFYVDYTFPNAVGELKICVLYTDEYLNSLYDLAYAFFDDDEEIDEDNIVGFRRYYEANYFAIYNKEVIRQILDYIIANERHKLLLVNNN